MLRTSHFSVATGAMGSLGHFSEINSIEQFLFGLCFTDGLLLLDFHDSCDLFLYFLDRLIVDKQQLFGSLTESDSCPHDILRNECISLRLRPF